MNIANIAKFLVANLVLGFILAALGATPSTLGTWIADKAQWTAHQLVVLVRWGGGYVVLGAMVLLPVVALRWLWRSRRRQ